MPGVFVVSTYVALIKWPQVSGVTLPSPRQSDIITNGGGQDYSKYSSTFCVLVKVQILVCVQKYNTLEK